MRKVLGIITILCLLSTSVVAQTEPEYRIEVGAGVGMVTYQGDFNGNILKNPMPMGSLLAKYRMTPRMALAMNVSYGKIKGSSKDAKTYIPARWQDYSFNHGLLDVGLRYELNFWPYGTGREYRGAKPVTPYIYIGVGMTFAKPDKTEVGMNMPLGAGVKYKVADRVNLALEWTMHFNSNDWIDGAGDIYGISSSGLFKNTDCYSHLRF
jgi:opacity protein-like surface antigen